MEPLIQQILVPASPTFHLAIVLPSPDPSSDSISLYLVHALSSSFKSWNWLKSKKVWTLASLDKKLEALGADRADLSAAWAGAELAVFAKDGGAKTLVVSLPGDVLSIDFEPAEDEEKPEVEELLAGLLLLLLGSEVIKPTLQAVKDEEDIKPIKRLKSNKSASTSSQLALPSTSSQQPASSQAEDLLAAQRRIAGLEDALRKKSNTSSSSQRGSLKRKESWEQSDDDSKPKKEKVVEKKLGFGQKGYAGDSRRPGMQTAEWDEPSDSDSD